MPFKEISAIKVSFDKIGQVMEGTLVSMEDTSFEGSHMFNLEQLDGKRVKFLGTSAIESLLADELGNKVRLTYVKDLKVRNGTMKDIKVEVWSDK